MEHQRNIIETSSGSASEFWVFAYGSLMWRPDFVFAETAPAMLEGAHRALCVYSVVHRGTYSAPGLVLGLDRGGHCHGIAYRVPAAFAHGTRQYLRRRELVTHTYSAATRLVRLKDGTQRTVPALCFLVNRSHRQYAGNLSLERQAHIVRNATGASGANIDYLVSTVEHLLELGVSEPRLEQLMIKVGVLGR